MMDNAILKSLKLKGKKIPKEFDYRNYEDKSVYFKKINKSLSFINLLRIEDGDNVNYLNCGILIFGHSLNIKEDIAEKVISSGLSSFDDIAYADNSVFNQYIDSEEEINRIKSAAEDTALLEAMGAVTEEEDNVESLTDLNLDEENIAKLSNKGIKNKDDLAELSIDELQDIIDISEDDASAMIMKAREHWFN